MSQEQNAHDEGPIQTPQQLMFAIVLSFVVPVLIIALLVVYVTTDSGSAAGSAALSEEATAQRILPVGTVDIQLASAPSGSRSGEAVYKAACAACHDAGSLGSPKFGDAAAWGARIGQGAEALYAAALNGKGAMPKQGGGDYTDDEVKRAVVYMANAGGANFKEPAASAPAGDAAADLQASADAAPAAAPAAAAAVPALYKANCAACHDSGVMNAPKLADKAAWSARLGAGVDGLTASAIKGVGMMPARGGSGASDDEIRAVVAYMVDSVK